MSAWYHNMGNRYLQILHFLHNTLFITSQEDLCGSRFNCVTVLLLVLQVAVRDVVGAGGSEATWRELSGLTPGSRVQVRGTLA